MTRPPRAWVAAVLLPPLGLHLAHARPRDFWIAAALTALGFAPGVVFALARLAMGGGPPPRRA